MKRSLLLAVPLLVSISACAASTEEEIGDVGDSSDALTNGSCAISRQAILAKASGARKRAIERAFTWWDAQIPYSQSKYHQSYRTDCSGFISMAWELGTSYTTADFINGGGQSSRLGGYSELIPGDALVRRSGGSGHIVMFLGWNDQAKSSACVIEQASTASDMQFRPRSTSSLTSGGYKAIRANKLKSASAGNAPPSPTPNDDDEPAGDDDEDVTPPTSGSTGGGSASCTSDGQCNPGNNGSGLICSGGRCVAGCRSDAQCPGVKICVSGQCR
jgi:hypothetical protein